MNWYAAYTDSVKKHGTVWRAEITGLKVGIVGLGKSGGMIADAMKFFGADITYFARSEKKEATRKGYRFLPLKELLSESEVVFCCLNKNTILLHKAEFDALGNKKILFNTGLSPAWDETPFTKWLESDNLCFCDTLGALGNEKLLHHPHVRCMQVSTGRTRQAFDRLSEKVLANLSESMGDVILIRVLTTDQPAISAVAL